MGIAMIRCISEQLSGITCNDTVMMLLSKLKEYYFTLLCIGLLITIPFLPCCFGNQDCKHSGTALIHRKYPSSNVNKSTTISIEDQTVN